MIFSAGNKFNSKSVAFGMRVGVLEDKVLMLKGKIAHIRFYGVKVYIFNWDLDFSCGRILNTYDNIS